MFNTSNNTNNSSNNGGITSFLKLKWRTSTKYNIKPRLPNTVDDIERDWVRHNALKLAFENDFKAPIERLLQAGGSEVLDIGCGAGFWTTVNKESEINKRLIIFKGYGSSFSAFLFHWS